jgi:hypothetical protein
VYGHDGGKEGYRSAVIFNPRTKTGVVVLTNARTSERPMDLARYLLFPQSPLPPSAAPAIAPRKVKVKAKTLDAYAGEYRLQPDGLLRIARSKDHLLLDVSGEGVSTMFPSSDREFYSNTDEMLLVFEVSADGHAPSLTLHEGDRVRRAVKVGELH